MKGAAEDRIDAAVAAGTLTKEQGDAAKKRIESGDAACSAAGFGFGGPAAARAARGPAVPAAGPGGPRLRLRRRQSLGAAATYLGLTDDALRTQLESGKSLADVAKAQNKDVAGLKAAMKTAITDRARPGGHGQEAHRRPAHEDPRRRSTSGSTT